MKKKILFLIGNLDSGGVSKSLVNLLNAIDRKKYDISLWVGSPTGIFYNLLPTDITLISNFKSQFLLQGLKGLIPLLKKGYIFLFMGSIVRMILSCFNKGYAGFFLSRLLPPVEEYYDVIIDYNGQHQLYFMVDKLQGKKKITFFHNDYSKWLYYYTFDKKYFSKVDCIFTVSEKCVSVLKEYFPKMRCKIKLMYNISSPVLINQMSRVEIVDFKGEIKLLSIGHVCKNKGTDIAIESAALLRQKGIDFKWYFLGNVKEDFSDMVFRLGLTDNIIFLGMRMNPYPYLKQCTLYIHPSRFEGKSVALDEAKILCKPIVVTNFSTVYDQFKNGMNASICEMTHESLADTIENLLKDKELQKKYSNYLSEHIIDNSNEIDKLCEIIEE